MQLKDLPDEYKCRMNIINDYMVEHIGINKSTASRWTKGETKVMKPAVIEKLSYLLGTDVGSSLKNSDRSEKPLLGTARAEYGLFAEGNLAGYKGVLKSDYYRGDYFLRVCSDSMIGAHMYDQNLIYVRQCDDVKGGTTTAILTGNTEVTVKCIIKKEPFLILEAVNPTVLARYFMQEEVRDPPVKIIGRVLYSRSDIA